MVRFLAVALMLGAGTLAGMAAPAAAADLTLPECMHSEQPQSDVEVRDVWYRPAADSKRVAIGACVVSRRTLMLDVSIEFTAFDTYGRYLSSDGAPFGDVSTTEPLSEKQRATIVLSAAKDFPISLVDPKHAKVSPLVLVLVKWIPCVTDPPPGGTHCTAGRRQSNTFVVKARLW